MSALPMIPAPDPAYPSLVTAPPPLPLHRPPAHPPVRVPARADHEPPALPDGERWATAIVISIAEVLSGTRPVQQLARWLEGEVYADLARRAGLLIRIKGRPDRVTHARVLSLRSCAPVPDVLEVTAAVQDGDRVRAYALRLEVFRGRWRVCALVAG